MHSAYNKHCTKMIKLKYYPGINFDLADPVAIMEDQSLSGHKEFSNTITYGRCINSAKDNATCTGCCHRCQKRRTITMRRRLLSSTAPEAFSETVSESAQSINPRIMSRSFSSPAYIDFPETVRETMQIKSESPSKLFSLNLQSRLSQISSSTSSTSGTSSISYRENTTSSTPTVGPSKVGDRRIHPLGNFAKDATKQNVEKPLRLHTDTPYTTNHENTQIFDKTRPSNLNNGTFKQQNAVSRKQSTAFATPSHMSTPYNQTNTKSQRFSSKSPLSSNIFTFRKLWASLLFVTILHVCSYMQSTSASPVHHVHSSSLNPSTSLPRRAITRKLPVYPIPASSSQRRSTVSVYPVRKTFNSGIHHLSRRGRNAQNIGSSTHLARVQSSPISNYRNQKVFNHGSPLERLTANVVNDRQEDRQRRESEEVPKESSYENYEEYEYSAGTQQTNNAKVVEQAPSEKETYMEELYDTKEKWVNPCGINFSSVIPLNHVTSDYVYEPLTDSELLQQIVIQVSKALRQSRRFKEDYVKKTFMEPNWWSHHDKWGNKRYNWLPNREEIPKNMGEIPTIAHLQDLDMETTLRNMYTYLQKLAVGLEQVALDQIIYDGFYDEEFNQAEYRLKGVLCELQIAMLEKGIEQKEDVRRDIMGENIRDVESDSYRNIRDWSIYRDYMNGLEYALTVFNHIKQVNKRSN